MWTKDSLKAFKMLVAGSVLIVVSGCSLIPKEEEPLKPPLIRPAKQNYETADVKRGTVMKQVKGIANFEPSNTTFYQYKESGGKLEGIKVAAGDRVKKGQLLVQLELEGLDIELKYKQLEYEKAKLALTEARAQKDPEVIKIRSMELDIAKMLLDKTREKYNSKLIYAEADGQVTFADEAKPGDQIDPYKVLVAVADPKALRLSYQTIAPSDIADVKVGMQAEVNFNGKKFSAKVVQTPDSAPLVKNAELQDKYSKMLYMTMDNIPEGATIGSTAEILITTQKRDNTLFLPSRGVRSYMGRNYVQILDGESRKEVDIEPGIKAAMVTEIISGLKEGQKVILQ